MGEFVKDVLLVVLGFALATGVSLWERRRRCRVHRAALVAELSICERLARTYLKDGIAAPLYRLPVAAFGTSYPALLADGGLRAEQLEALAWFWAWAQDINRGLDAADDALRAGDHDRLRNETSRLQAKCRELLEGTGVAEGFLLPARKALE